jgi:hypothetical protein
MSIIMNDFNGHYGWSGGGLCWGFGRADGAESRNFFPLGFNATMHYLPVTWMIRISG